MGFKKPSQQPASSSSFAFDNPLNFAYGPRRTESKRDTTDGHLTLFGLH